ncbi:hypothetical protein DAI22_10g025600 [Oryza sativa Japonica Group]|nr:hypothetical protein DAI22_10g025600 [Oryza sativa Japonica Group]
MVLLQIPIFSDKRVRGPHVQGWAGLLYFPFAAVLILADPRISSIYKLYRSDGGKRIWIR